MSTDTWRQVAEALAERMHNHAYCDEHAPPGSVEACPYCRDVAAYDRYLRKAGLRRATDAERGLVSVPLSELRRGLPPS